MPTERVLQGTGSGYQDKHIPVGGGATSIQILEDGILVGSAQALNFIDSFSLAVDGGDPNQINITLNLSAGAPVDVDLGPASAGVSTDVARADHHHALDQSIAPTWTGVHNFNNDVFLNANVDLGSAITDSITFNGRVASDVLPIADNVHDLGSPALRWAEVHVGPGSVVVHNDATDTQKLTFKYVGAFQATIESAGTGTPDLSIECAQATGLNASGGSIQVKAGNATVGGAGVAGSVSIEGGQDGAFGFTGTVFLGPNGTPVWIGDDVVANNPFIRSNALFNRDVLFTNDKAHTVKVNDGAVGVTGRNLTIQAGGKGGDSSGAAAGRNAGTLTVTGSTGGAGTAAFASGRSSNVLITTAVPGTNLGGGSGPVGFVQIAPGSGNAAIGAGADPNGTDAGTLFLGAGVGGAASAAGTAGKGSLIVGLGGPGGPGSGAFAAGEGGSVSFTGGDGGADGGAGGAAGGAFTADAGLGTGAALAGVVNMGTVQAEAVNIGRTGKNINLLGNTVVSGDVLPDTDNTLDLGSPTFRWAEVHVGPGSVVVHNDATDEIKLSLDFSAGDARVITANRTTAGAGTNILVRAGDGSGAVGGGVNIDAGGTGAFRGTIKIGSAATTETIEIGHPSVGATALVAPIGPAGFPNLLFVAEASHVIQINDSTTTGVDGATLFFLGASGGPDGALGGDLNHRAGNGGAGGAATNGGTGGNLVLDSGIGGAAGAGSAKAGNSGAVIIRSQTAGSATATANAGDAGNINIQGNAGGTGSATKAAGNGGNIINLAGAGGASGGSSPGFAGEFQARGGDGANGFTTVENATPGGQVFIAGGLGGNGTAGAGGVAGAAGGNALVFGQQGGTNGAGSSTSVGAAGAAGLVGATGRVSANATVSGTGGSTYLQSGFGGAAGTVAGADGGVGGSATLTAGNGGDGDLGGLNVAGAGGVITLLAGSAGADNGGGGAGGGSITLTGGAGSGAGAGGSINLGAGTGATIGSINIGLSLGGTTINLGLASALIGLYGATAVVQHSTTGQTAGFVAGAGTGVNDDSTFTGGVGATTYTIGDVVRALKQIGLMAS